MYIKTRIIVKKNKHPKLKSLTFNIWMLKINQNETKYQSKGNGYRDSGWIELTNGIMYLINYHLVANIVYTWFGLFIIFSFFKYKEWVYQPHLTGIWSLDFLSSSSLIPNTILQKPSW